MQKRGEFINLFRSARIERTFPSLTLIIFACALVGKINKEIYLLSICLILLYVPGGILNALKDKDYELPPYSKIFIYLLPLIALIISIQNKILFLATISWIITGFIYNVASRKILFLDNTFICMTHHFIPVFFSLIILGHTLQNSIFIGTYVYLVFWFLAPIKNLNGIKKDIKLKYKTVPSTYIKGKQITFLLYYASFILMIPAYFIFELNFRYLILLCVLFILFLITKKVVEKENYSAMLNIARIIISLFGFAIAISLTNNLKIIVPGASIVIFFFIALIKNLIKN